MALNKQAKILTSKQQELALSYLERTRYPLRNKIIFLLSYKAGGSMDSILLSTVVLFRRARLIPNCSGKIGRASCRERV